MHLAWFVVYSVWIHFYIIYDTSEGLESKGEKADGKLDK